MKVIASSLDSVFTLKFINLFFIEIIVPRVKIPTS